MVEPVVKWAGGKRQLLPEITGYLPRSYETYHEPFVGGGAVFFHLAPAEATINDLNSRLITLYEVINDSPEALIDANRAHEFSETYYYDARDRFNELHTKSTTTEAERIEQASLLVYLNRTCFNGLYRENSDGEFNVSMGDYSDPDWIQADRIRQASRVLQTTRIFTTDFEYVQSEATAGDLVYLDPPYEPVSPTADFNSYHADGFDRDDQRRLRDLVVDLDGAGVSVIMSNSPPVADLYADMDAFSVDIVDATRAINSDASNRGAVAEVIITNVASGDRRRRTLDDYRQ